MNCPSGGIVNTLNYLNHAVGQSGIVSVTSPHDKRCFEETHTGTLWWILMCLAVQIWQSYLCLGQRESGLNLNFPNVRVTCFVENGIRYVDFLSAVQNDYNCYLMRSQFQNKDISFEFFRCNVEIAIRTHTSSKQ